MSDLNDPSSNRNGLAISRPPAAPAYQPLAPMGQFQHAGGPHPGGMPENHFDLAAALLEYWRIGYKRKLIILSILGVFVAVGTIRTLMMVPLYVSAVRLQIDRNVTKVVEGGNVAPAEGNDADFLRTQYELLQSRTMAERVVSALRLGSDSDFFRPRQLSALGLLTSFVSRSDSAAASPTVSAARDGAAVGIVLGGRSVRPVPGSRLVDIAYADPSPQRAQRIALAFAEAYIASNLDKRFEANSYAKTFLEDQLKQLKLRLEEADKKLLEFAEREQIVTVSEKSSIAENNLAAANTLVGNLASERIKYEQLWKQVEGTDAINLPQYLSNQVISDLRSRRKLLELDYQEKLQTFKPGYPAMVELNKKMAEIDRQIAAEVKAIRASHKGAYDNALSQEKQMVERVDQLKAEVLELQKQMLQYSLLKREVDTNRSLYDGLLQRYKEIDVASGVGTNNVFIVDRPQVPGAPSSPNLPNAVLTSLAMGLGAGLLAAFIVEKLDDRINSQEDAERITGIATIGVIPKVSTDLAPDAELADPRSALSEAYRSLSTAMQFTTEGGLPKSLLVTSAMPSEGKSITSYAIARHFASLGLKVLLVDADLRKPSLHTKLGLDNSIGLSNYLTGACTPPEAFQRTPTANLMFMPSGPLPPNAADLLASSRLLSLVSVGLQVFDLIVIDGPPVMGYADALLLSNAVAGTAFVTAAGQARVSNVRGALRRMQHARAPVIGTILTKYDPKRVGYGAYGYSYGGYGYGGYGYGGYGYGQTPEAEAAAKPQISKEKPPAAQSPGAAPGGEDPRPKA